MNFVHFYVKDTPRQVLLAVQYDNKYFCQVPFSEKGNIHTSEFVFDSATLAAKIQSGHWKLVKINNFLVEDLIKG